MDKMIRFVREAITELRLSSWLSRQQMIGSTVVVIAFSIVMAIFVSLVDRILLFFTGLLFRIG
jgi:preprotein translocase SecE subunit